MRLPDPIANTTTEAYLAYKAGVLEVGDLKPSLYDPYLHFDAWLAYWCGLTSTYPSNVGKNLMDINDMANSNITVENGVATGTMSNLRTSFGQKPTYPGIPFDPPVGQMVISLTAYTEGNEAANPNNGLRLVVEYTDGTSVNVTWKNSDTSAVQKTIVTDASKTVSYLYFTYGNYANNIWHLSEFQIEKGSSATPYEPHFIPEMLTDEEALVAYLSGVTDTYPEEIKDPYDVRIVGYLKYLVSVKYGRPEYPVNNEEFYLSLLMPPSVSNDTPASSITLQGTAKYPFLDLLMYGDCAQQTYTGKNLFSGDYAQFNNTGGTGYTYAYFKLPDDGEYTMKMIAKNAVQGTQNTYLGFTSTGGTTENPRKWCFSGSNQATAGQVFTKTNVDANDNLHYVSMYSSSADRLEWFLENFDIQLEKGITATDYEPYVGGIPAPNPDYPQEVHMVTGKQTVKVTGKNILYIPDGTRSSGGIDWTEKDGFIIGSGTSNNTSALPATGLGPIAAGNYCIVIDKELPVNVIFAAKDSEGTWSTLRTVTAGETSRTFTVDEDKVDTRIGVSGYGIGTELDLNFGVMIQKGSTPSAYEPYQSKSTVVPLTCKNMFNKDATPTYLGLATATPLDNGIRVKVGTAGNYRYVQYVLKDLSDYENPVIAMQANIEPSASNKPRFSMGLCAKDGSNSVIRRALDASGSAIYTPAAADRVGRPYLFAYFYANIDGTGNVGDYVDYTDVQVEISDTATDYVPYHPPIELCKIGDYQDYIYKNQDGDWYLHKEIGLRTYASPGDAFSLRNTSAKGTYTYSTTSAPDYKIEAGASVMSPQFKNIGPVSGVSPMYNALLDTIGVALYYSNPTATDRVIYFNSNIQASTLLANGIDIYYQMATPTDTLITYPDVVDALNEVLAGGSYDETTYIEVTADDDNLPGLLTVTAGKE